MPSLRSFPISLPWTAMLTGMARLTLRPWEMGTGLRHRAQGLSLGFPGPAGQKLEALCRQQHGSRWGWGQSRRQAALGLTRIPRMALGI